MKKLNKKGFTLVELVIVIAVIAILAGVLIPTFSKVIQKANQSVDTQLIRNLNTAVAIELASEGKTKYDTAYEAVQACKKNGYDVKVIVAKSNYNVAYDLEGGHFVLLDENEHKVMFPVDATTKIEKVVSQNERPNYFVFRNSKVDENHYSIYAGYGWKETTVVLDGFGFDAGEYTGMTQIEYKNQSSVAQKVVIRTDGQMSTLTINGIGGDNGDTVYHYGFINQVFVNSVGNKECYHEAGTSNVLEVKAGKVVVESTGNVFEMKKSAQAVSDSNAPTFKNNGGNVLKAEAGTLAETEQITNVYNINSYEQLCSFRDATNSGMTFEGITVNLNCDITLKDAWRPISNYSRNTQKPDPYVEANDDTVETRAFRGIFDGHNHTIINLTNVGLTPASYISGRNSSTPSGQAEVMYGFFASINGATIKNLKFTNVKITNSGFGTLLGDSVGACVGFSMGGVTIDNITVSGSVEGYDSTAGILGRDKGSSVTVKNCTNNASVWAYQGASGIVGRSYGTYTAASTIENCINNGAITSDGRNDPAVAGSKNNSAAGITYFVNQTATTEKLTIKDCTNNGEVKNLHSDSSKASVCHEILTGQSSTNDNWQIINCKKKDSSVVNADKTNINQN